VPTNVFGYKDCMKKFFKLNFEPIVIFYDNHSTMKIAKNHVFHVHAKQIEVHYHDLCENLENEKVELVHVPSQNQFLIL
jgi:succinylglutamate desuccinylase